MLFVAMCHDHDRELRLVKPRAKTDGAQLLYDIFECPNKDCNFENWSFKPTQLMESSVDIIRAAIADLNGATNRLGNILKPQNQNPRDDIR